MVFWYTRWDGQRFCSENDYGESKQNSNKLGSVEHLNGLGRER